MHKRLAGAAALLVMALCTFAPALAAAGSFTMATTYQIDRMFPHPQTAGTQLYVDNIFDPLVTVTKDGILPRLAKSWTVSDDGTVVKLTLRDDVTFQDGTPFDAKAAQAALAFTVTPDSGARVPPYLPKSKIEATGPYELTITLPARAPELLGVLAQYPIFKMDDSGKPTTIGTGPFRLDSFQSRQNVVMVANDHYWGGRPKLDRYEIRMFPDTASELLSLEASEVDAVIRPPIAEIKRLSANEALTATSFPDSGNMMWGLNVREGHPTADQRVRKALDLAFDRQRFIDVALGGVGKPTNVLWPPSSPVYFPEDESWKYDLDAAKKLVDEAGAAGSEVHLLLSPGVSQEVIDFAPIYQADLATIGINAVIDNVDTSEWLDKLGKGDFDVYVTIYGNTAADPALAFTSGNFRLNTNFAGFVTDKYAAFEQAGRTEPDPAKRTAIYRDLNRYMQDEAFAIPFAQNPITIMHAKTVSGIEMNSINNVEAVDIEAK